MADSGLYIQLWKSVLPKICYAIDNKIGEIQLKETDFKVCGNRISYTFRLDIVNGIIPQKEGSAVARDLKIVLEESPFFKAFAIDKHIVIRLTKNFILKIIIG